MKPTIAFYIKNARIFDTDVSNVSFGNPGIGGSEFEEFLLIESLQKQKELPFNVVVFLLKEQKSDISFETIIVPDITDAFKKCNDMKIDFIVLRANDGLDSLDLLKDTKIIFWAHNYLGYKDITKEAKSPKVVRMVFVSRQEYDYYIEHDIIKKSVCIFNAVPDFATPSKQNNQLNKVVYVGAVSQMKNVDSITRIWPKVKKAVPDAELLIIGSGALSHHDEKLGPHGVAEEHFEAKLFKPLMKDHIESSVHFLGVMGQDKTKIISGCKVGIIPSKIETFCLSATDIISSGIPVVALKRFGFCDVITERSGKLVKNEKRFSKALIAYLSKDSTSLTESDLQYMHDEFGIDVFTKRWMSLFDDVINGKTASYQKPTNYYSVDGKRFGLFLRSLRRLLHLPNCFSRIGFKYYAHKLLKR
jgi:glycosyltransferase involved in cell wall biosynthesis